MHLPGTSAQGHEPILLPSGKNSPVRGGYRSVLSVRWPDSVSNSYQ